MKPTDQRHGVVLALVWLAACDREQPVPPAATTTATNVAPANPPVPSANERLKREPSLTEVKYEPPQPGVQPSIEVVPNPDGQTVTVREYHPSGWLYTERGEKLVEGGQRVRHGSIKAWHDNRQLMQSGAYVDGKLHGHWTYWNDMGAREREGDYDQGLRSGDWREWHPNGQMKSMGLFHVNLAEGPWKFWHDNGQLMAQGEFINNKREGQWMYWLADGTADGNQTGIYEDNHRVR